MTFGTTRCLLQKILVQRAHIAPNFGATGTCRTWPQLEFSVTGCMSHQLLVRDVPVLQSHSETGCCLAKAW